VALVARASRGEEPAYWRHRTRVEQRDVPPRWEGLDASEELWPYQEPGSHGETRDGEMLRGEISTRVLHERIPLSFTA